MRLSSQLEVIGGNKARVKKEQSSSKKRTKNKKKKWSNFDHRKTVSKNNKARVKKEEGCINYESTATFSTTHELLAPL